MNSAVPTKRIKPATMATCTGVFLVLAITVAMTVSFLPSEKTKNIGYARGIIRNLQAAAESYATLNGGEYPSKIDDMVPFLKEKKLPLDPRTNRSIKLRTVAISSSDFKRLEHGDKEIANRFCEHCAFYYGSLDNRMTYCLFCTDDKGNVQNDSFLP